MNKYLLSFLKILQSCLDKGGSPAPLPSLTGHRVKQIICDINKKMNTLQKRAIVTIIFMFVTSIALIAFILDSLMMDSYARLENQHVQAHLRRLQKVVERDLAELASTAADWGPWDETYSFMLTLSEDYISTNLTESVFHNLGLNMMVFLKPDGTVFYARGRDLANSSFISVPEKLIEQLVSSRIFHNSEQDYTTRGFLMLPENPVLIASHPILTSTLEGPVRGHLLVGRFLNDIEISRYEELLNVDITVNSADGGYLPQQNEKSLYVIKELSEESIVAYTILEDIFGEPAVVLSIKVPREISAVGKRTTGYLFASLTGASLVVVFVLLVFLKKNIFSRLTRISDEVKLIGSPKSTVARLTAGREKDELSVVTNSINDMLDKLEQSKQQVIESEKKYRLITENTTDTVFVLDLNLIISYVSPSVINLRGYTAVQTAEQSLNEIFAINLKDYILQIISGGTNIQGKSHFEPNHRITIESEIYCMDGTTVWVENSISLIRDENEKPLGILLVSREITETKQAMEQLKYLSLHDQLTGLFNRTFFEAELKRLNHSRYYPITIISADLDGLKLVNDTMGHDRGDLLLKSTADILTKSLRRSDILCRVGGDEFAAILPHTDAETAETLSTRIRATLNQLNRSEGAIPLDISLGVATTKTGETSLSELYKQADDLMYKDKLHRNASNRNRIVQTLLAALSERDYIAEGHAQRLAKYCHIMGKRLNLSSGQLADLSLLAQVHDLGKVGIPDSILYKEGPLCKEEMVVMQRHPEIGFRIAMTSPDLASVADLILKHHEKWDGSGYPLGLKGEEIPIECRILSIVDTFDAITHDRPYRKARSRQEAVEEIKKHAESQFDPALVILFIDVADCCISTTEAKEIL
jgi:diguanylate cyclase (GGDEF)-like protein/PAS domain S-box-containing protein